jgi:uncharacterized membrane protein YdjX (TVP38/TMEM64 family)
MTRAQLLRLALLALALAALLYVRYLTTFGSSLSTAHIRDLVAHTGAAGIGLFIVVFAVGELLHVPGMVFVAAAVMAWGPLAGGVLSYVSALVSISLVFVVVRTIGGQPLATVTQPRVRALLAQLETRPILTVALLRLFLWLAPPINYALALSTVRYRDYAAGSALGLVIPAALAAVVFGVLFR